MSSRIFKDIFPSSLSLSLSQKKLSSFRRVVKLFQTMIHFATTTTILQFILISTMFLPLPQKFICIWNKKFIREKKEMKINK